MQPKRDKKSNIKAKNNILDMFGKYSDIAQRSFIIKNKKVDLFFIDCLINKEIFTTGIVSALKLLETIEFGEFIDWLEQKLLAVASVKKTKDNKIIREEIWKLSL